jgi:hypothetical protein
MTTSDWHWPNGWPEPVGMMTCPGCGAVQPVWVQDNADGEPAMASLRQPELHAPGCPEST